MVFDKNPTANAKFFFDNMVAHPQAMLNFRNSFVLMIRKISEGSYQNFPVEVYKICMSTFEGILLKNVAAKGDEVIVISNFLSHCFQQSCIDVESYHKCIEIVLNSLAISIDNTKIECFKIILFQSFGGIVVPPELDWRIEIIELSLNYLENKKIVKVNHAIQSIKHKLTIY